VELGWPVPAEFDSITALRNRPAVRRWFLDDRQIDPAANRAWLASGMNRPWESLLAVRWRASCSLVGTVGWSSWDPAAACASFGRIMVDRQALRSLGSPSGGSGLNPMLEAAYAIRAYAFEEMRLERAVSFYVAGNSLASKIQRAVGLHEVGRALRTRPDGRVVTVIETELTRCEYRSLVR
jgi:RimJ/RimL family protein N-acetyltransferase